MRIKRIYHYILVIIILASCKTYKTFYKETSTLDSKTSHKDYRLDLSNVPIDSIKVKLEGFTNIYSLDLSNQKQIDLDHIIRVIPNPNKIKVLILDGNNLSKLPESIKLLSELRQISLNNNPNLDLKQALKMMEQLPLVFINLQNNELTKLPPEIANISTLKDLNLSKNRIEDNVTFQHLSELPALTSLWLTRNKLDQLPKGLSHLKKLKNLYVEHNNLLDIPTEIEQMEKVWVLHAGHNKFKELPEAFAKMPSLILLHINDCDISNIPQIYGTKESSVMGLILDNNNLDEVTKKRWKKKLHHYFLLSIK